MLKHDLIKESNNCCFIITVGIGFTSGTEADIWHIFPQIIQDVFAGNCVAVVFVVSIILSLVLPKDMNIKKIK